MDSDGSIESTKFLGYPPKPEEISKTQKSDRAKKYPCCIQQALSQKPNIEEAIQLLVFIFVTSQFQELTYALDSCCTVVS
jgi:hypothetical protein